VLVITYPYFDVKSDLIQWLWANGALLLAIVGGFINPHTRTLDVTHAGIPTLNLTRREADWPGRYAWAMNKELGLGHVLNTETRELFSERGTELLSQPERIIAMRTYILDLQKKELWLFAPARIPMYLLAVFPHLLTMIRKATTQPSGARSKLEDVNAEDYLAWLKRPVFGWDTGIRSLGENEGMEATKVLQVLSSKGVPISAPAKTQVLAIINFVQRLMHIDRACVGGARVTLVGRLKEAETDDRRRQHVLVMQSLGTRVEVAALKLEFTQFTAANIHNSEIFREAHSVETVSREMARYNKGPMKSCIPRLLPLFVNPGHCGGQPHAAVGVHKCGDFFMPFMLCEAIREDLGHSVLLSDVQAAWKNGGQINEVTRCLAQMILHTAYFMQFFIGLVLMDHSYGNLFILSAHDTMPWLHPEIATALPGPGAVGWCDLGSAIYVQPWKQRLDGREKPLEPLMRQCTQPAVETEGRKPSTKHNHKILVRLRLDKDNIGIISKSKLLECAERRKEKHGGLGRLNGATPGYYCVTLRELWRTAGEGVLTMEDIDSWESYGNGALIYSFFCPRRAGVSREVYLAEQRLATLTPGNMRRTMLKYVLSQECLQPRTVDLWANLLYHLMRPISPTSTLQEVQNCKRTSVSVARLHPAVTSRALSPDQYAAISSEQGLLCPAGPGPPGTQWAQKRLPACTIKIEREKGPGVVFAERVLKGQLAALYVAVEHTDTEGMTLAEYPPCRSNVSINDDESKGRVKQVALGTLPLDLMLKLRSLGPCMNAGDNPSQNNLSLQRTEAESWSEFKGVIFIPFLASRDINEGEFANWRYDPFNGKGGLDSYVFNDQLFTVDEGRAEAESRSIMLAKELASQSRAHNAAMATEPRTSARGRGADGGAGGGKG